MRRSAHRSRPSARDSGQIDLDFGASSQPAPRGASVVSLAARRAAVAERAARAARTPGAGAAITTGRAESESGAGTSSCSDTVERSAADWFELGYELEASPAGSIDQARDAYRRAIAADDGHADAHLNLGRLLHESGDLDGAERHYRRALEAAPDEATAAFNLGVVLEDLHRELQAIAAYERAMASDPDFIDAYHNLVRLHEKRGDKPAALRVLKRLRERTR